MRAAVIRDRAITIEEVRDPVPGRGELLVKVLAAGLNGADLLQRAGLYPAPSGVPADIPGLELAGVVVGTGADVERFGAGDTVMAVVGGGAQAELGIVHERTAIPVPDSLGAHLAGGVPEAFTTAHDALFTQCGLEMGERVLVSGAAGGVGIAGVQLAVCAGATVVASVRADHLRSRVAALGATAVAPQEAAGLGPYDVVLELVGAPNLADDLASLATGGRIAVIGVGAGALAEIDMRLLMQRRGRIHGSTLRSRPLEDKAAAAGRVERHVVPLLASGRISVLVEASFGLEEVASAYERFASGAKLGKILLDLSR